MALVPCPECQKEVSTRAVACPQCAYPFPGKPASTDSLTQSSSLHSCPDCGFLIPNESQACPNCAMNKPEGPMPLQNEPMFSPTNGDLTEETWLCPHCGIPYTRKVKKQKLVAVAIPQEASPKEFLPIKDSLPQKETPSSLSEEEFKNLALEFEQEKKSAEMGGLLPLRSRSPLWEAPVSGKEEIESSTPYYPKKKKVYLILAALGIVVGVVASVLFAFWYLKGLTPMDLLSSLQF